MDRKEFIDSMKGKVLSFKNKESWIAFNNEIKEIGVEFIGSGIDIDKVWNSYPNRLGVKLVKDGRSYKLQYLSKRLAETRINEKLKVVEFDVKE